MSSRSCALTRRPIHSYDRARVIFLTQNPSPLKCTAGAIHTTDAWAPVSMPLRLLVEDFASDFQPWGAPQASCALFLQAIGKSFEEIGADLKAGAALFEGRYSHPKIGMMAMHEVAYQRMTRSHYDCGRHTTPAMLAEDSRGIFETLLAGETRFSEELELHWWFDPSYTNTCASPAVKDVPQHFGPRSLTSRFRELGVSGAGLDHPQVAELISETCEMFILQMNMEALSIPYGPGMIASEDFCTSLLTDLQQIAVEGFEKAEGTEDLPDMREDLADQKN